MNNFDYDNRDVVCIDYNGVMDTYHGEWGVETPLRDGLEEFMRNLIKAGYRIIVFSSNRLADVEKQLSKAGLLMLVSEITNIKRPAVVYLDDRAVTFNGNFDDAYKAILEFKAHWESDVHYEGSNINFAGIAGGNDG